MKLLTCNIRYDCRKDGENNFCFRAPLLLEKILAEQPDLICFQEVLPHVAAFLKENLRDYYIAGCGRSGTLRDEEEALAWRRDRLNLISMDTFWLSPTPGVPGSRYLEQSICPRVCTTAVFELLDERRLFRVYNIHLDHMGVRARQLGLEQIVKDAEERETRGLSLPTPVILAGDFNTGPDGPEVRGLAEGGEYLNLTEGIGITYHGFSPEDAQEQIDYIFAQSPIRCSRVRKWEDKRGNIWLSDHYPVCGELYFEQGLKERKGSL